VKKFIQLNDWFETGMEGTDWIGYDFLGEEYSKSNYENIIILNDGDKLTIYKDHSSDEILWEGVICKMHNHRQISNNL
jgi:hypothetical protein